MPTDTQRQVFVAALNEYARSTERRSKIQHATGVSKSMVTLWLQGKHIPDPEQVFAIEEACDLPGGALSHHLGYVPVEGSSVMSAIESDPTLSPKHRRALEVLYLTLSSDVSS